jgi:hypothetical protein
MKNAPIPGEDAWAGHADDLDAHYAYKRLHGKSIAEVIAIYCANQYEADADSYRSMPRAAFRYYIFAFAGYLREPAARFMSDAASVFLKVLLYREQAEPGAVRAIYPQLADTVDFVASHQEWFDAEVEIYGDFREHAQRLRALCE